MCSIDRNPSRVASAMSLAVTSFWKSTNAFARAPPSRPWGSAPLKRRGRRGCRRRRRRQARGTAEAPPAAACACRRTLRIERLGEARGVPLQAPAELCACTGLAGQEEAASPRRRRIFPRDWENRWMAGRPPARSSARASQGTASRGPPTCRHRTIAADQRTRLTRPAPRCARTISVTPVRHGDARGAGGIHEPGPTGAARGCRRCRRSSPRRDGGRAPCGRPRHAP